VPTTDRPVTKADGFAEVLSRGVSRLLFPSHLELLPQVNQVYELELAFLESHLLTDDEIIRNGAYFAQVGDTLTRHFLMCSGEPVRLPKHSSSRLRLFFKANQFKTGYATHGLFPYRGKFHPQMVKGLLNVMGLKPGETVLDPMMGSGTALIEARLMGIRSVGIDASPFCRFMTQAKLDAMTVPLAPARAAMEDWPVVYQYFQTRGAQPTNQSAAKGGDPQRTLMPLLEPGSRSGQSRQAQLPEGCHAKEVRDFLLLAYLDGAGYSQRSSRKAPREQFRAILERYLFVAEKIQQVLAGIEADLAEATALEGDARHLPLDDSSIDGILFSPPYSFAIDYLENDSFHLDFMGVDVPGLREKMIGLRGRTLRQKFDLYRRDMDQVLSECARVLRPGRICAVIVGTNSNQLSSILGVAPSTVGGIDEMMVGLASPYGLQLVRKLTRQITGMANTMRDEHILLLQRH